MMSQPEQDPKKFSPKFEESLQRQERIEARAKPAPRRRVRVRQCEMDGCVAGVHRNNTFSICVNHMLLIWKHVEGAGEAIHDTRSLLECFPKPVVEAKPLTDEELAMREMAKRAKARELATAQGHLYVMDTQSGLLKIGWTSRLQERLSEYPPTFNLIVTCSGTRADERDIHRSLSLARAMKREWYYVTPEVVRQINTMIAAWNVEAARSHSDVKAWCSNPEDLGTQPMRGSFEPADHHITTAPPKAAPTRPTKTMGRRVG